MNLRDVLTRQQAILTDLEAQINAYETSDLFRENAVLKNQVQELSQNNSDLAKRVNYLKEQNTHLQEALFAHANKERSFLINKSKERLWVYFGQAKNRQIDNLTALETDIKFRTGQIIEALHQNKVELSHPLYQQVKAFQEETIKAVQEAQAKIAANNDFITPADYEAYNQMQEKPLTPEQVLAIARKYSMERFVGHKLISTIGIILIIIAAIFVGQFTLRQMTDAQRTIGIFIFGGGLLVAGEFVNRKKARFISLIVSAGGVAILYIALAFSYFALDVFGMIPALAICVAITAVAFYMSTRYKAQVLLVFAFVGGHLPFAAIGMDTELLYGLMVHFIILNLLVLLVSFKMKWMVSTFIGLALNSISIWVILITIATAPYISPFIMAGYIFFAFAIYTAVPIIGTYVTKARFNMMDAAVIGINTVVSCATMYIAFLIFGWADFLGLLALVYAVVYFALALILWKRFSDADTMRDLAALTGLVFFILIIPFQFDIIWLSLGWLLQGVAMGIYGILKSNKRVRYAGFVIFGLCLLIFVTIDISMYIEGYSGLHFGFRYLSVTVGSLLILGAYIYKKAIFTMPMQVYKNLALANIWIYLLYLSSHLSDRIYFVYPLSDTYLVIVIQVIISWVLAFSFSRMKSLFDSGTRVLVIILYIAGIAGIFIFNFYQGPSHVPITTADPGITIGSTIIIVALVGLAVFSLYDLLRHFVVMGGLNPSHVQVIVSGYALTVITQNILLHYGIAFTNIWLSVFYVLSALGFIIYGFAKKHMLMRRIGLGLALITVAKVFFLDLAGVSTQQRIISFFIMGVILMGIGYMYQYFSKRLEANIELDKEEV